MRHLLCLISLLGLMACDLTDPDFLGTEVTRVQVGQSLFEVRQRGDKALALRINSETPQRYDLAMTRAVLAIERATGCLVTRAGGDPSAAEARLDCGPASGVVQQPRDLECDAFEVYDGLFDVDCRVGI